MRCISKPGDWNWGRSGLPNWNFLSACTRGRSLRLVPSGSDRSSWNRLCRTPKVVSSSRAMIDQLRVRADADIVPAEQTVLGDTRRRDVARQTGDGSP